ncbi:protein of unknown function [Nitratireductor aquimarinus]
MPFPREETTPPVIKTYRAMGLIAYPDTGDSASKK